MTGDSDDEPDLSWLARGRGQLLAAGLLDYDQTQDVVTFHQSILDEASRRRPADEICNAATAALLMHYVAYLRDNLADNVRLDRCAEAALVLMESVWSGREQEGPIDAVLADMTRSLGNYLHERGLAASLHQLAILEFQAGERDAARQLWERSIWIAEGIGHVAGAAQTRIMLAQLEALDGRFERAIELATAAVRELERLGYADAEQARDVLRGIEAFATQGGAPQGAGASHLDRLGQQVTDWQSLSGDHRAERLAALAASEPVEAVLGWLAHSAVCWQQGDAPGCDAALDTARTIARTCGDAELLGLVDALGEQRAAARSAEDSGPDVLTTAIKLWEQGDTAGAAELLEQVSALARAAGDRLAEATCQFYLGQAYLLCDRAAEAVATLRGALDLATEADDPDLIRAVQQVLTIAVQEGKASENG
jgi:tetratricopeptide (TPR) repeat protein